MRDLWDAELAGDFGAIGSLASPLQLNLAVINRKQPMYQSMSKENLL